jgi:branched-chain amino acid transport system ATP-binding protein
VSESLLSVSGVDVFYGKSHALKSVTLEIFEGEVIAVLGPNGAGKTSLMRAISGLIPVSSGTVTYAGKNITNWKPEEIVRERIIHVPQGRRIFPEMTVFENIEMGAFSQGKKEKLKELYEKVYALFPKLYERRKQIAGTLSGGEQQMLAVGRALMASPRLLMMDEPSMGLAPIIIQDMYEKIREIARGETTILLVEQNAVMAFEVAQRAYFLDVGAITMSGRVSDLQHSDVVSAYLGVGA